MASLAAKTSGRPILRKSASQISRARGFWQHYASISDMPISQGRPRTNLGASVSRGRPVLVTGGAGFIGSHIIDRLLADGCRVTAIDNFDDFYDVRQKRRNVIRHTASPHYSFADIDIRDCDKLRSLPGGYDVVVHLAAKAGVRQSIDAPCEYFSVNVGGTLNLLECSRAWGVRQFVFASSSSVYGRNTRLPWRETDYDLRPISPYASTKLSGESIGHVYSVLYGMRFAALRLFTVYGPRQRPDLAIHKFARAMHENVPVPVYGPGDTLRDYTYVDDVVEAICAVMGCEGSNFEVINIGRGSPVALLDLLGEMERISGFRARLEWHPQQRGDVTRSCADIGKARALLGYEPRVTLAEGLRRFFEWFLADREPADASVRHP